MFLWAWRSKSYNTGPGLLEMLHLKNMFDISFLPSCVSFKHSILTQIKINFPKVLTCVVHKVLCCHWYQAHIVPLCRTTANGTQRESTSLMWSLGNNLLHASKSQEKAMVYLSSRLKLFMSRLVGFQYDVNQGCSGIKIIPTCLLFYVMIWWGPSDPFSADSQVNYQHRQTCILHVCLLFFLPLNLNAGGRN